MITRTISHAKKIADYEVRSGMWLGNGNEALEKGKKEKAEQCFQKAQYWLDKSNKLRGWS
ncbi:MAG: hypothetical protein ACREAU_00695 [Nitrosopumilaceae archaeon]